MNSQQNKVIFTKQGEVIAPPFSLTWELGCVGLRQNRPLPTIFSVGMSWNEPAVTQEGSNTLSVAVNSRFAKDKAPIVSPKRGLHTSLSPIPKLVPEKKQHCGSMVQEENQSLGIYFWCVFCTLESRAALVQ